MSYRVSRANEDLLEKQKKKEKKSIKYPKIFKQQVNINEVNFDIVKQWISNKINEQLPDDDIVIDYLCELLQAEENPDIKSIHIQMKDFLGDQESMSFCEKLWNLLLSAQQDSDGIPSEILEQRKREVELLEEKQKQQQEARKNESQSHQRGPPKRTNYNRSLTSTADSTSSVSSKQERDNHRSRNTYSRGNHREIHTSRGRSYRGSYTRDERDLDPKDSKYHEKHT